MKRKVLERFNWERTVDATERLYRRVLKRERANEGCVISLKRTQTLDGV